jgi:hypothetical protein
VKKIKSDKVIDPMERPICTNKKGGYDLSLIPESEFGEEDSAIKKKEQLKTQRKKKKPVYDARKAIEEAKEKEKDGEKEVEKTNKNEKNDKGAFREFLKSVKKGNKSDPLEEESVTKKRKNEGNGGGGGGFGGGGVTMATPEKNKKETAKQKKQISEKQMLRKKLHEIEKNARANKKIKEVKSKISCWGESITHFDSINNNNNLNSNANHSTNFNSNPNDIQNNTKPQKTNKSAKKRESSFSTNKHYTAESFKQVTNNIINLHSNISKKTEDFDLSTYLEKKQVLMKEEDLIPQIKPSSFYVKQYSPEIYDELLFHLDRLYNELK